jgi:dTDP-4-dehydrorhamnose reductase
MKKTTVLVLGVTGMLGHTLFSYLSQQDDTLTVYGAARNRDQAAHYFPSVFARRLITQPPLDDDAPMGQIIRQLQPDLVINCIGIIKQVQSSHTDREVLAVNALFPHRLANLCRPTRTKIIHVSTDCVFDGLKGNYNEQETPRPVDLYGFSKYLGELDYPHCLTLRTSIIGHELRGNHGLVEWFLARSGSVRGYREAIYSGLPTVELAEFIGRFIIPNPGLSGIYHLSADPISKYELLGLIKEIYGRDTVIEPTDQYRIDRSLDSTRLRRLSGYQPPVWPALIAKMHRNYCSADHYQKLRVKE